MAEAIARSSENFARPSRRSVPRSPRLAAINPQKYSFWEEVCGTPAEAVLPVELKP
jgi:hypothetical protein